MVCVDGTEEESDYQQDPKLTWKRPFKCVALQYDPNRQTNCFESPKKGNQSRSRVWCFGLGFTVQRVSHITGRVLNLSLEIF